MICISNSSIFLLGVVAIYYELVVTDAQRQVVWCSFFLSRVAVHAVRDETIVIDSFTPR